jgi:membrane protease YdiL (CAAX protease family)
MATASLFSEVRRMSASALVGFVLLHIALKALFFSPWFLQYFADPVYDATRGIVTHSAAAGLTESIVLLIFIVGVARLCLADVGLRWDRFMSGVTVTVFVWAVVQTLTVALGRLDGGLLAFGRTWDLTASVIGARVIEAQSGGAFIEEIIYRGVLLPQVYLVLRAGTRWAESRVLFSAAIASQAYFAINHLPAALRTYAEPWSVTALYLVQVLFVGLLFAAVYLRTGNLFVAMGLHALLNFPGELFTARVDPFFVVLVVSCAILIAWPYLNRSLGDVFTLRPALAQAFHATRRRVGGIDEQRTAVL